MMQVFVVPGPTVCLACCPPQLPGASYSALPQGSDLTGELGLTISLQQ